MVTEARMKTQAEIEQYLADAEQNAIMSLAANKWERFGYWASQAVHLRRILGLSNAPSPFRPFAKLARSMLDDDDSQGGAGGGQPRP